jgi:hypothetical protein
VMIAAPAQSSFLATRRGKLTLAAPFLSVD